MSIVIPACPAGSASRPSGGANPSLMDPAPRAHTGVLGGCSRPGHRHVPLQLSGMPTLNSQSFPSQVTAGA